MHGSILQQLNSSLKRFAFLIWQHRHFIRSCIEGLTFTLQLMLRPWLLIDLLPCHSTCMPAL